MTKQRVLFICVHNSARSQMAEAFLRNAGSEKFDVESAGLEPGTLNPLVVEVMQEKGIDISHHHTKSVNEFLQQRHRFNYVITVCDETNAERCPVFPGTAKRLYWSFKDPSQLTGTHEEKIHALRSIRNAIEERVQHFLAGHASG